MSTTPQHTCWLFIVDTETYSGNFEREMVAWMTGAVGDCGVGSDQAALAQEVLGEEAFGENLLSLQDDSGCSRPATIWPTPGWFNDGLGNHWREGTDPEIVRQGYEDTAKKYKSQVTGQDFPGLMHCSAYMSVACAFEERPTDEQLALLAERARSFKGGRFCDKPNVVNTRLVHYVINRTEIPEWEQT